MHHLKRLLPLIVLLLSSLAGYQNAAAQGIEFVHNLDSALMLAKAANKPIFIDFYTSWCAPCKVMSKDVFPQEKVGSFFNKQFINCKVQCDDKGIGVELGKKYQVYAYPTLMFLNSDGEIIHSAAGSFSDEEFMDLGNIALNPDKNQMSLLKKWESGQRDTAFVNSYFNALKSSYRTEFAQAQFDRYFNELSKNEKTSKNTFELIKLLGFPPFSKMFNFVEENRKAFYRSVGAATIDPYLSNAYTRYLQRMAMVFDAAGQEQYKAAKAKFKAKNYPTYNETIMYLEVFETFDSTGRVDIKEYQRRGTAFLNKYGLNNDSYTLSLVSLLGNCTGRENEGAAGIQWMENLLARNPDPKYLNTYFYILWRNYHFDKSLEVAQQIRNNAIRNNQPTKEIDGQITMITDYRDKLAKKKSTGQ
jgi:thioredoxin-related protein